MMSNESYGEHLDCLEYQKNQTLFMNGNTPLGIYIVKSGRIILVKLGSQGKEQVLKIYTKGDMIGCMELILNIKYENSAKTISESQLIFLPRNHFHSLLNKNKELNQKLLVQFAREIRDLHSTTINLAYKPVRGRLADSLLFLNEKIDDSNNKISFSRKELAGLTGTVKETVNRLLLEFQKDNLIALNRQEIHILDIEFLQRISKMYD